MGGTSLAKPRRIASRLFTERVFVGRAIDIGCGPDPITTDGFPLLRDVQQWDLAEGDATLMADVQGGPFDLVYSSHCLEHIRKPYDAVTAWWRLVKVGGHLVIVVPDEELYERNVWPPTKNGDHKNSYTTMTPGTTGGLPTSLRFQNFVNTMPGGRIISLLRLEDGFDPTNEFDQTALGTCECGIELVVRKEA